MVREDTLSKVSTARAGATASADTSAQPRGAVVKVGQQQFQLPEISSRQLAAAQALETFKSYRGSIDSNDVKVFINSLLQRTKSELNAVKRELATITSPMEEIRRQALTAKRNAENAYQVYIDTLTQGERILKDEILRWDNLCRQRQIEAQRTAAIEAQREKLAREQQANTIAEQAARETLALQDQAHAAEQSGDNTTAQLLREQAETQLLEAAALVEEVQEEAAAITPAIVVSESVKLKGTAVTGRWVADVTDPIQVCAGVAERSTPADAVKLKIDGKLVALTPGQLVPCDDAGVPLRVEAIVISMAFFNDEARRLEARMNYRGVKSRYVQDLRVTA